MISYFKGDYAFLSNMHRSIFYDARGIRWKTVEHGYQAYKAKYLDDFLGIQSLASPYEAKKLGSKIDIVDDWADQRLGIMRMLVSHKFHFMSNEARMLMNTNGDLVEGNTWGDTFWGVCRGAGDNNLGKILMEVRQNLLDGKGVGQ